MSLKKSAASGVKWTTVSSITTTALQFIQLAVLARLLSPEDFGLMAMVAVVIGFAAAYADMGISAAIIHRQDATREQLSSLYWLNLLAGLLVYLIILVLIPLIVVFYHEVRLAKLIPWAALILLLSPIGTQFQVLLQKELRFRSLALIELSSALIGFFVTVNAAIMNEGVFSIIWGQLSSSFFKAIILFYIGFRQWRPLFVLRFSTIRKYMSFGFYQIGERSINFFSANIDYILIGHFLGPQSLGVYTVAYQIIIFPLQKINPILTSVAFPIFARKQNDQSALQYGFIELSHLLALVVFPLLIGFSMIAPIVIPLLFGDKWLESIFLIQILVLVGLLKTLSNPSGSILLAKGRADIGFKWNLFLATTNFIVFFLCVKQGVYTIAWACFFLSVIYFFTFLIILNNLINLNIKTYLLMIVKSLGLAIIMGVMVKIMDIMMIRYGMTNFLGHGALVFLIFFGAIIYILLILKFESAYLKSLIKLLFSKS